MTITSHEFLLLFLPLTVAAYYGLARDSRQKMYFLLAISYVFYSFAGLQFIPVLLGLTAATYWAGRHNRITAGILLNLAALLLFKYWNFGLNNINAVLGALGISFSPGFLILAVPLGLSFFVFKHIGYLLDIQQKRNDPASDFWLFAAFSAYFPQLSAGPISSYKDTAPQFLDLPIRLESEALASGLIYITFGLAKKILVADTIGELLSSPANSVAGFSGLVPAWYMVIAYALQLYFDFSGYTDIVLGASLLFGIRLPQNFNNPYLANNASEFWDRWHMSLSVWFRNYLFFPLSRSFLRKWGTEKREKAQCAANLVTMTLVGLWHGAGWNYILWGFYHGLLLNWVALQKRLNLQTPPPVQKGIFLLQILFGWALFMSGNLEYLQHLFSHLLGFHGLGGLAMIQKLLRSDASLALIVALPITFSGWAEAQNLEPAVRESKYKMVLLGVLAAISIFLIQIARGFIYIQF